MGITIVDIARLANVSRMTVSRVINESGPVSEETRLRVQKIIDEHQYTPNVSARNLRGYSNFIAVVAKDIANPYYNNVMCGIEHVLRGNGHVMLYANANNSRHAEEEAVVELLSCGVRGMILLSSLSDDNSKIIRAAKKSINIVAVESDLTGVDAVNVDNKDGVSKAISHLISQGHREIGLYGDADDSFSGMVRLNEYLTAMKENNFAVRESAVFTGKNRARRIFNALGEKNPPTAVMALNDHYALEIYELCRENGISIPHQLSVTGFDNLPVSHLINPGLTTLSVPMRGMGEKAAELLMNRIKNGRKAAFERIKIISELVLRESVASR